MKIGAQSQRFEGLAEVIGQVKPAAWKFVDPDAETLRLCREASPGTLLIARVFTGAPKFNDGRDPGAYGREYAQYVDRVLAQQHRYLDFVEAENEPVCHDAGSMMKLADFTAAFATECARLGWKPVVCNFSEANPEVYKPGGDYELDGSLWNLLAPALRVVKQVGGVLGLHEYNAPDLRAGWSEAKGLGYRIGRYRAVYRVLPADLQDLPLILSEYGADWLIDPYHETGGWAHRGGTIESFVEQLRWAHETMLARDRQVIAALVFGWQMYWPQWEEYDVARTEESRAAFMRFLQSAPQPVPVPGGPMDLPPLQFMTERLIELQQTQSPPGLPHYWFNGGTVMLGENVGVKVTVLGEDGRPVIGAQVVDQRRDGKGEILLSDGTGSVHFNYGRGNAYTPPERGPHRVCVALNARKDPDTALVTFAPLSTIIDGLGQYMGGHEEYTFQLAATPTVQPSPQPKPQPQPQPAPGPVVPPALTPDDEQAIAEVLAAQGIGFNADSALWKAALAAGLGLPVTAEVGYTRNGVAHVAQRFERGIAFVPVGLWGLARTIKFF